MANWTLWSVSVQVCVSGEGAIVLFPELSSGAIEKKQNHTNKNKTLVPSYQGRNRKMGAMRVGQSFQWGKLLVNYQAALCTGYGVSTS